MWERSDLKRRAKIVLKRDYRKALLISLVIAFASGMGIGGGGAGGSSYQFFHSQTLTGRLLSRS
jgi:hypothetical protein